MKLGFIYAGQGTQYVGMGQSFYENDEDCKNLLDNVKLDFNLKDIIALSTPSAAFSIASPLSLTTWIAVSGSNTPAALKALYSPKDKPHT